MFEFLRFTTPQEECSYLPEQTQRLSYRVIPALSDEEYDRLLARGWRRFAYRFFRPVCPACAKCRSLRVDVANFAPNKSQRRVWRANQDLRVELREASVSREHVTLYNRYHAFMHRQKGWPHRETTEADYMESFLGIPYAFAHEFAYYLDETLVGIGLVDITPKSMSSIYFFHDPELRPRALGVFSMLKELQFAAQHGIQHHYLGFWIPENASMSYKNAYRPFDLLVGVPMDDEPALWVAEHEWREVLAPESAVQLGGQPRAS